MPDAFIAFSYPPDTFMMTEQMQILDFNPQIMYLAIGTPFPGFKAKFGNKVNGILLYGGVDPGQPGLDDYNKAHSAMFNRELEAGAVSASMAALEVTQQAIETGRRDRPQEDPRRHRRRHVPDALGRDQVQEPAATSIRGRSANGRTAKWSGSIRPTRRARDKLQFPKPAWG